ncbi:MAG: hypothetical protein GY749_11830 [Desulfobacteraceae bacterium]|nr:hypothetical protein [Desulfobacteraceae bacterium]
MPSTLLSKNRIVVRKEDVKRFGNSDTVSLEKILQDKSLRMGRSSKISNGKEADAVIKKYESQANIFYRKGTNVLEGLLQMLLKKRIDYVITLPFSAEYVLKPHEKEKLAYLKLKESQESIIYYSLCAKTEWGREVIGKIEAFLQKERQTEQYRSYMERWMPAEILKDYRHTYDTEFLKAEGVPK